LFNAEAGVDSYAQKRWKELCAVPSALSADVGGGRNQRNPRQLRCDAEPCAADKSVGNTLRTRESKKPREQPAKQPNTGIYHIPVDVSIFHVNVWLSIQIILRHLHVCGGA